jgi:hypothetical protein
MEIGEDSIIAAQTREYVRKKRAEEIKSRLARDIMTYQSIRASTSGKQLLQTCWEAPPRWPRLWRAW